MSIKSKVFAAAAARAVRHQPHRVLQRVVQQPSGVDDNQLWGFDQGILS